MSRGGVLAQVITVVFSNGKTGKFVGPAIVFPEDGPLGHIGIKEVHIGRPKSLHDDSFFAEAKDGTVVLMKAEDTDEPKAN